MGALVDVYSAQIECPFEGCFFVFLFENVPTEDEGNAILHAVVKTHLHLSHDDAPIEMRTYVMGDGPIRPASERPKLVN